VSASGRPPAPRLALRREEAAQSLGMSDESFDRYVRPYVPVFRCGALLVWPVSGLAEFVAKEASSPMEDIA
jgi:hypothetical protein